MAEGRSMIIDTHAHLDQIDDGPQALEQASTAGVEAVLAVGVDLNANQKNLRIQSETTRPRIFVALGLHPGSIQPQEVDRNLDFIRANIGRAVAVGEIGLDFWYKEVRKSEEKREFQKTVFQQQLAIARDHDLPVIIHSRGAWPVCVEMVRSAGIRRGVFHWYSGPVDLLKDIFDLGFFISATPSLAYSPQAREAVRASPPERTLIETDSPVFYKTDGGANGFFSRPRDVFKTLELYAELKGMPAQQALEILNENARTLLGLTAT